MRGGGGVTGSTPLLRLRLGEPAVGGISVAPKPVEQDAGSYPGLRAERIVQLGGQDALLRVVVTKHLSAHT